MCVNFLNSRMCDMLMQLKLTTYVVVCLYLFGWIYEKNTCNTRNVLLFSKDMCWCLPFAISSVLPSIEVRKSGMVVIDAQHMGKMVNSPVLEFCLSATYWQEARRNLSRGDCQVVPGSIQATTDYLVPCVPPTKWIEDTRIGTQTWCLQFWYVLIGNHMFTCLVRVHILKDISVFCNLGKTKKMSLRSVTTTSSLNT